MSKVYCEVHIYIYTEYQLSAESKGLRFQSSWGLRIFSLFHTCDWTKNIFPYRVHCCLKWEGEVGGFKSEIIIKIHCSQEYMFFKNLNVCF